MAEAPKAKKAGGKKLLGLDAWVWAIIGMGGVGIYYVIHKKTAAANALAGTTDGQTTPDTATSGTTTTLPTTLQNWFNDALGGDYTTATYSSSDLLNDLNGWLSGNCVSSQGYNVIGNLVTTLGVPPGYSTTPALSVCASSGTTTGTGTTTSGGTTTDMGGSGSTLTTSTGTSSNSSVPSSVQAAIDAVAAAPSAVISNIAQGQNPVQAANNANDNLPTLSQSDATTYESTTGNSYSGPVNLGTAEQATQAKANSGLLASLGYTPAQIAAFEAG